MQILSEPIDFRAPRLWRFADTEFDEARWELRVHGATVDVEPRPLRILAHLLRDAGKTVSREDLLLRVWGHPHLSENVLTNAVGKLRRAIGDREQALLLTVHRVGYRLAADVSSIALSSPAAPRSLLAPGSPLACRPDWVLERWLDSAGLLEWWLARNAAGAPRVLAVATDDAGAGELRRGLALTQRVAAQVGGDGLASGVDHEFGTPPYFVAFEGATPLCDWTDCGSAAGPTEAAALVADAAQTLARVHAAGVFHGELSLGHILVEQRADGRCGALVSLLGAASPAPAFGAGPHPAEAAAAGPLRAPERGRGHPPSAQADVYSLGVLLYQLVARDLRKVLTVGWEADVADELLREDICAAACGDPARRIGSATQLADRLRDRPGRRRQRHDAAAERARAAANASALARTRARRPWVWATAGVLVASLVACLGLMRQAIGARDEARHQAAIAQAIDDFLNNELMAAANPYVSGSTSMTVAEAARRAAARIDVRFAASPELALTLHETVGDAMRTIGDYPAAETEFRRAESLARHLDGTSTGRIRTAQLRLAQILAYESRFAEAAKVLAQSRSEPPDAGTPLSEARRSDVEALLAAHEGDVVGAAQASRITLALLDSLHRDEPGVYDANAQAAFMMRLHAAQQLQDAGERTQAVTIERALIGELLGRRGPTDPLAVRVREQLVDNLLSDSRIDEAEAQLGPLERDAAGSLGTGHPVSLRLLSDRARVEEARGRWPTALAAAQLAAEGSARLFGPDNDATVRSLSQLGRLQAGAGRTADAASTLAEAYARALRVEHGEDYLSGPIAYDLASLELDLGRPDRARALLHALQPAALERARPRRSWDARLLLARARLAGLDGHPADAREDLARAAAQAQAEGADPVLRKTIRLAIEHL